MSDVELSKTAFLAQATAAITKLVTSIQELQNKDITILSMPKTFDKAITYKLGIHHWTSRNEIVFEIIFNFAVKEPTAQCTRIDIAYQTPVNRNGNEQAMQMNVITKIRELNWTNQVLMNGTNSEKELGNLQQVLQHA